MKKRESRGFVLSLMESTPAVYLATVDEEGSPQVRAVSNLRDREQFPGLRQFFQDQENPFVTFLTTFSTSEKARQIRRDPRVALYYCRPEDFHGVMLSGTMQVERSKPVKVALWQDAWSVFWTRGPEDSRYRVLRFEPERARGWSGERLFRFTL